jgi:sugar-phosphatase
VTAAAAVLFDVYGVLLDSTAAHRRVWTTWAQRQGLDPDVVWQTFDRRPEDTVQDAALHLDPAAERRCLDALLAGEKDGFPAVDGAADLLNALPPSRWAIVTSGDREAIHERFALAGLPLPTVQVYGADVEQAKPAPGCFLLAASRLGVSPSAYLVVEDTPAGVQAARAAGCTVVGLTTTHTAAELHEAHTCADSLAEVAPLLDVTPPGSPAT